MLPRKADEEAILTDEAVIDSVGRHLHLSTWTKTSEMMRRRCHTGRSPLRAGSLMARTLAFHPFEREVSVVVSTDKLNTATKVHDWMIIEPHCDGKRLWYRPDRRHGAGAFPWQ